jgi:hypothetical protein
MALAAAGFDGAVGAERGRAGSEAAAEFTECAVETFGTGQASALGADRARERFTRAGTRADGGGTSAGGAGFGTTVLVPR